MFSQRPRRDLAARNRRAALRPRTEMLEGRQLLSYSPIGSLPDLTVTAQAGAIAAYGGPIAVTLDVRNLGASTLIEPLNLQPGSFSTADAGPSRVGVYLLRNARALPGGAGSVLIGEVAVPGVPQNSLVTVSQTLILPQRPRRFPGSGGNVFLGFKVDDLKEVADADRTNNVGSRVHLQIQAALPDLATIALDVPPVLQPGDTIAPSIKVANYGTVDTASQAAVTVLLVASTDTNYGPTDVILGRYQITNLPGLSQAPQRRTVLGDVTVDDQPNVITLETTTDQRESITLPTGLGGYFVGVIVDPLNTIRELHEIGAGPSSALQQIRRVAVVPGLPPAGPQSPPSPDSNLFPIPAFAPLLTFQDFLLSPGAAAQSATATGGVGSLTTFGLRGAGRPKATGPAHAPTNGGGASKL